MLARSLGMTVAQLSREMSATEENYWIAEYRARPWGELSNEVHLAQIAQILFNTNAKKGKTKPLHDFLIFHAKKERQQSNAALTIRTNFENFMAMQQAKGLKGN